MNKQEQCACQEQDGPHSDGQQQEEVDDKADQEGIYGTDDKSPWQFGSILTNTASENTVSVVFID